MSYIKIYSGSDLFSIVNEYIKYQKDLGNFNLEFEYKINCTRKTFIMFLENMKEFSSICELEQTSNSVIKFLDSNKSFITSKFYASKNHNLGEIQKSTKQKLLFSTLYDYKNIKLSVSIEQKYNSPSNPPDLEKIVLYRIKNRLSFTIGKWRYDFTLVISLSNTDINFNNNTIAAYRNDLFDDLSKFRNEELFKKFILKCDLNTISSFEFEIEYIGSDNPLLLTDFLDNLHEKSYSYIYYDQLIYKIADLLEIKKSNLLTMKSILPAAQSINASTYNRIYPPIGYYISYKADGDRCLIIKDENNCFVLITSVELILLSGKYCYHSEITDVLEGELMVNEKVILLYDIFYKNKEFLNITFDKRLVALNECVSMIVENSNFEYKIEVKKTFPITDDLEGSFKNIIKYKFPYKNDGYILTNSVNDYFETKNYKIKEHNTIDFLAVKVPKFLLKKIKYDESKNLYLLFNGASATNIAKYKISMPNFYSQIFPDISHEYQPVLFNPSDYSKVYFWEVDAKLDKQLIDNSVRSHLHGFKGESWVIVELEFDFAKSSWIFHRIRNDRINETNYYGNDYFKSAIPTWMSAQNPIKVENMHIGIQTYFKQGKNNLYFAQTAAISFAKSALIQKAYEYNPFNVMDIGSGNGQDLFRYINAGFEHLLVSDIDKVALLELMSRYYESISQNKVNNKTHIKVLPQDYTQPAEEIYNKIVNLWQVEDTFINPGTIICNLAIHYIISNLKNTTNFITLVNKLLNKDGRFIFTTFDGEKIYNLLKINNGDWIEGPSNKFRIKANFNINKEPFREFGQEVLVKLPFTGDELYSENLVNINFINKLFIDRGFTLIEYGSISDYLTLLKEKNNDIFKQLLDVDKKFIGLYSYVILQKN